MALKSILQIIKTLIVLYPFSANTAVLFTEDFSDNSAGWTLGTEWQIGPASPSTGQYTSTNPDPGQDHTATSDNGVAGVVIGGNASTTLHPYYYLTSPVIDTNVSDNVSFEYWRWLNSDYTPYMQNNIQVFDGSTWNTIWESGPAPAITDDAWTYHSFDITSYKNSILQIRFGHQVGNGGVYTVSSWNIDDIAITTSPVPVPAALWLFGSGLIGLIGIARHKHSV